MLRADTYLKEIVYCIRMLNLSLKELKLIGN